MARAIVKKILNTINVLNYNTVGTFYWTVPDGITKAYVKVVGAGASGFRGGDPGNWGGGGGGGGVAEKLITLTPGEVCTIVVGLGGNTASNTSQAGGSSSFTCASVTLTGTGGGASTSTTGGSSGTGTNGDINYGLGNGGDYRSGYGGEGGGPGGGKGGGVASTCTHPGAGASAARYDSGTGGGGLIQILY